MDGKTLKSKLNEMGYTNMAEIARLLGMNSAQHLHITLQAQDIKTGLLENLARVLNLSVADFYPRVTNNADNGIAVSGDGNTNTVNNTISEQLVKSMLDKKDEHIARLLAIIEQMSKQ